MIVLVANMSWMARGHLGDIWRKAIRGDDDVDDSNELMFYRGIVFGGVFRRRHLLLMDGAGTSIPTLVLFILATLILYTGITHRHGRGLLSRARRWLAKPCRLYARPPRRARTTSLWTFRRLAPALGLLYGALSTAPGSAITRSSAAARSPFAQWPLRSSRRCFHGLYPLYGLFIWRL